MHDSEKNVLIGRCKLGIAKKNPTLSISIFLSLYFAILCLYLVILAFILRRRMTFFLWWKWPRSLLLLVALFLDTNA